MRIVALALLVGFALGASSAMAGPCSWNAKSHEQIASADGDSKSSTPIVIPTGKAGS